MGRLTSQDRVSREGSKQFTFQNSMQKDDQIRSHYSKDMSIKESTRRDAQHPKILRVNETEEQ